MADILTSSQIAANILSGTTQQKTLFNNASSAQEQTQNLMKDLANSRLEDALARIDSTFERKASSIEFESDRLVNVKAQMNNVKQAVDNAEEQLDEIRTALQAMLSPLQNIENGEDIDVNIEAFDSFVMSINTTADRYSEQFNLVGNSVAPDWEGNTLDYSFNLTNGQASVQGVFAGVDFYLEDENAGTVWRFDRGADTLEERTEFYGDETGQLLSTRTGITSVDSYDAETGAISMTVTKDGETTETMSGTLKRGGLSVMQSWFYNGFKDADGNVDTAKLTEARDAINKAFEELDLYQGKITAQKNQVDGHNR